MNSLFDNNRPAIHRLKKSRLLESLPDGMIQSLTPFLKVRRFPKEAEILKSNPRSIEVYFLIRGKIAIYSDGNLVFRLRRLGDMIGDMGFITDRQVSTKEVADTPVELLSLNLADVLEQKGDSSESLKWAFYQLFTTMLVDKLAICCVKASEQQNTQRQLEKLKQILAETRLKIDTSSKIKQNFLININHEIRTPMHGVLGMTSLLLNTDLSDLQREFAQTIHHSAHSFLDVINNLLDFSKLTQGGLDLQNKPFELRKIIQKIQAEFEPKARGKNLTITTIISKAAPVLLKGDPVRIHQVLINLVGNAIKFTESGGIKLIVDVTSQYEHLVRLRFAIRDTGIGISVQDRDLLFKSFSQVDTSLTRNYGGTGLGLVISKQLVEAMSGDINVESEPGKGSTFWFTIDFEIPPERRNPKHIGLPQHRKRTRQTDNVEPLHLQEKKNSKLLLVSNNKIDQIVLLLMMEKLGYSAIVIESGSELLAYLQSEKADVILLDTNITDSPEIRLTQKIQDLSANLYGNSIPLIALTSDVLDTNRSRCLQEGMNDCLAKPVAIEDLDMVLQRWISIRKEERIGTESTRDHNNKPFIDLNMLNRLKRDVGAIDVLIKLFLQEIPNKIVTIKISIQSEDYRELEKSAHTLKSNCITFGAMMMADLCFQLEIIGSQGSVNGAQALADILDNESQGVVDYFQGQIQD